MGCCKHNYVIVYYLNYPHFSIKPYRLRYLRTTAGNHGRLWKKFVPSQVKMDLGVHQQH